MKTKRDLMLATSSQLAEKLVNYGMLALLARAYDKVEMGVFFYALVLAELGSLVAQLGTNEHLVRSVAAEPEKANESLGEVVGLRLISTAGIFTALNAFVAVWRPESLAITALTTMYVMVRNLYFAYGAFFVAQRRISLRVWTLILSQLAMLAVAAAAFVFQFDFLPTLGLFVGVNVVLVALAWGVARRVFGPAPIHFHLRRMSNVVKASAGLFMLAVLSLLRFKVDTLMLGVLPVFDGEGPEIQVARYESAYKIFEASRFLVRPAVLIYLPICAALFAQAKWAKLGQKLFRLYAAALLGGLVMAGGVIAVAPWLMVTLYGEAYADATPVLRVLFLTVPVMYLGFVGQFMANAMHLERRAVWVSVACLVFNVLANAWVIPRYGAEGAAWTTLATEALSMAGLTALVFRRLIYRRNHPDSQETQPAAAAGTATEA